jgi:hypothetical protein
MYQRYAEHSANAIAKQAAIRHTPAMRQKELRIALVCYGGVSLAVYMHGATAPW